MRRSRIIGTGSHLPSRTVGNAEISRPLRLNAEAIERRTGIRTRRWAAEDEASSDLAALAALRACEAAGVNPGSVEAILLSTTSPDMTFPSTACLLQQRLKATRAAAFDVAASCSGFLYGLSMADALIRSGQYHRCLVVAAEVKSKFLDPSDEATAILFGDGAGAALVTAEDVSGPAASGILGVRLHADGSRYGMINMPAGGSRKPASPDTVRAREHTIRIQGVPLFRVAVKRLAEAVAETLKEFGVGVHDLGRVVFHQANGRLLSAVLERLKIPPDKMYSVLERFGNASSASLPIALDYAVREGRIAPGELVLLGTFGGGLTWGTALMRW
ncbi:MAG TPA: beta-ketoacyl-ACP synthase III [Nitrospiraceae bacterium]|nr:beta-ketoacyl-ACP synthase III [Nitrospiraceae bacterium]